MDQMQMRMARMHQQNYNHDMELSRHFQDISRTYASMAQGEYQMYQMHAGQAQGMQPGQMQGMPQGRMPGAMPGTSGTQQTQPMYTPMFSEAIRY
jgi:hypothetical protein